MEKTHNLIQKIEWSLAPLVWGATVWFFDWGPGSVIATVGSFGIPLSYLLRLVLFPIMIVFFFGSSLSHAYKHYKVTIFGYSLMVPPWWVFMLILGISVLFIFTSFDQYETIHSLIRGVIISVIVEEFITRSFFIKYSMRFPEFLFFNLLSSASFMIMHAFYFNNLDFVQLMSNGHFGYSFTLSIIVYKARRIELTILLHMLSNLFLYTIPVCLLACPWPSVSALILNLTAQLLLVLCVGGCSYRVPASDQTKEC